MSETYLDKADLLIDEALGVDPKFGAGLAIVLQPG